MFFSLRGMRHVILGPLPEFHSSRQAEVVLGSLAGLAEHGVGRRYSKVLQFGILRIADVTLDVGM